ncbi:MAG: ABC transporter ATP-binding protein [Gemmataceae bacterium]
MIALERVHLRVGNFELQNINLRIEEGQYAVLMGKTGCGKTSILEAIAGLRSIESGKVYLNDQDVTHRHPAARGVGYVPQDLALFPTLTVREHLAFALEVRKLPQAERVAELAKLLGIEKLLERRPLGLSGGEAQRVALGRALAFRPAVLLLDEPLSALDEETRGEMIALLKQVQRREGVSVLHVTHSKTEAKALADRLFRLEMGWVKEQERLHEYSFPLSRSAANGRPDERRHDPAERADDPSCSPE